MDKGKIKGQVIIVVRDVKTGLIHQYVKHDNLITTAGEVYYAEKGATGSATDFVDGTGAFNGQITVGTAGNTPAATSTHGDLTTIPTGGSQTMDSTYPRTSDPDVDNPGTVGPAVITYRASYGTSEGNGTIDRVAVTDSLAATGSALIAYAELSTASIVVKTNTQTMKVFCNHQFADDGV